MIQHYLKIALRNLLRYKSHCLISALCLAIGMVCFSSVCQFISLTDNRNDFADYNQRITFKMWEENNSFNQYLYPDDIKQLEERKINGLEKLSCISWPERNAEVTFIDEEQQEKPYLTKTVEVNNHFYTYEQKQLIYGNRLPEAPDEIVLSEQCARKVYGDKSPIGMQVHVDKSSGYKNKTIPQYKIVNIFRDNTKKDNADIYFSINHNPYATLHVHSTLTKGTNIKAVNKALSQLVFTRKDKSPLHITAISLSEQDNRTSQITSKLLGMFFASLILISGLINFLKFIIQMFHNRQRELALRKSLGSDIKGFFCLLFAEIFWMISLAFLFSLLLTEITVSIAQHYIPQEDIQFLPSLSSLYIMQLGIYVVVLLLCVLVIIIPIYRLRSVSITRHIVYSNRAHRFRNTMMWLQLSICIFFMGGAYVLNMALEEMIGKQYSPLTQTEEKQIICLSINSQRLQENMDAILSDISTLPEITDKTFTSGGIADLSSYTYADYYLNDKVEGQVIVAQGDPNFFQFFHIPMEGEIVKKDASNVVYVSKLLKEQMEKENLQGMISLGGENYRVVGTFKALYKESTNGTMNSTIGSVFFPNQEMNSYYFQVNGNVNAVIKKLTEICRRYVPETLPLNMRIISDIKGTKDGAINIIMNALRLLAGISILLVILSLYSAISMDTVSRQKEIAIRKINGASPKAIALIFGKSYIILGLLSFAFSYPLLRLILIKALGQEGLSCVYNWSWGIILFFSLAVLIFLTTAYKIYKIMHINPSEIIKNE